MQIMKIGLDYRTAPVQLREQFTISTDELAKVNQHLLATPSVVECALLSTCNRTEVYAVVDDTSIGVEQICAFMSNRFDVPVERFWPAVDVKEADSAIRYLFSLACGLESMVVGETQILGQLKEAFYTALEAGTTGTTLNTLFQQVITFAKRAHSETEIGQHAVSVSYAAVELGKKIYGALEQKSVLILGAGKMSELTVKHLAAKGVSEVVVVNRTLERARELAARFNGQACDYDQLSRCLSKADIVISSTGAARYIIDRPMVEQAMQERGGQPLFLIDIAVPRDLEPAIHTIENVFLYDIDDLNGIVQANRAEREKAAAAIANMINNEVQSFDEWRMTQRAVPLISALRSKAQDVQQQTMQSILNKCPDMSKRERKVIEKHTKSIANQLIREPIQAMKQLAVDGNSDHMLDVVAQLYALETDIPAARKTTSDQSAVGQKNREADNVSPAEFPNKDKTSNVTYAATNRIAPTHGGA